MNHMSLNKFNFIINKFDTIDQSEIANTIINNIKIKKKKIIDYFPDTESNSDYRAVKECKMIPGFIKEVILYIISF